MDDQLQPGDRVRVTRGSYRGRTVAIVRRVESGVHAEAYEAVPDGEDRPQWFGRRSLARLPPPAIGERAEADETA